MTAGHKVTDSAFDSAKGYLLSTLKVDKVDKDKKFTCYMDVNNVKSQAEVMIDVIGKLNISDIFMFETVKFY